MSETVNQKEKDEKEDKKEQEKNLPRGAHEMQPQILSQCSGFLRVLRFPLPIFIPPIAPQLPSSIVWGLYNRPEVAVIPSGLSPTPLKISRCSKKALGISRNFH
jgi:hypothetical protein